MVILPNGESAIGCAGAGAVSAQHCRPRRIRDMLCSHVCSALSSKVAAPRVASPCGIVSMAAWLLPHLLMKKRAAPGIGQRCTASLGGLGSSWV